MTHLRLILATAAGLMLSACGDPGSKVVAPAAAELTRDAIGHYCNMIVEDHVGPKGQVFIGGRAEPIWFTSVRDTLAFTYLPEEPKNITAIYVNDMGRASWHRPEPGTWINAHQAWYVVGSNKVGGMGAPEAVPFAERLAAESFAAQHGGQVVALEQVSKDYVLAVAPSPDLANMHQDPQNTHGGADARADAGAERHMEHAHRIPTAEAAR